MARVLVMLAVESLPLIGRRSRAAGQGSALCSGLGVGLSRSTSSTRKPIRSLSSPFRTRVRRVRRHSRA